MAASRANETACLADPDFAKAFAAAGLKTIRYDEATENRRFSAEEIRILRGR